LQAIEEIPELEITDDVRQLGEVLINEGPIPETSKIDAFHIATASVNGMNYLLTWNCKHIANVVFRPKVEAVCRKNGFEPPLINKYPTKIYGGLIMWQDPIVKETRELRKKYASKFKKELVSNLEL